MRTVPRTMVIAALVACLPLAGCAPRSWPLTSGVTWPTAPDPSSPYKLTADFDQRAKMRDGVELSADVYRPDAAGRYPVILGLPSDHRRASEAAAEDRPFVSPSDPEG